MNFQLTEEQILTQKTAREFADNELAPGVVERDEKKIFPKEGIKQMAALGFMGMMVEPKWGGGGMDSISYTIAMEEISRVEASSGVVMSVNNSLVCYLLEKFSSDHLKEKYLKPLASGKKLGAFSLSEPQSGSDASNMRTFANKDGDHYYISGTKNWVTNGINSDYVILFAVTEKGIGHKGVSCFLVEKGWDGFETGKPIQFGKPISKNQAIQFKIADMGMEIEAARLLIRQAAWKKDQKQNYGHLASMAKVYASEVAMRASTQCVQIHGGFGYMRESGIERLMRDAKITQIYEGTSEIQRVVIARELLKK
jgi:alkylation response protein AidB-like acyl-CoA dehydrogenase